MNPEKEIVKKAFAEAENEAKEKQVQEVKRIVVKTLERLDAVKKEIKELQEKERVLKMDIDDLKEGRLDLIAERHEKDPEAKKISVVLIIKEKEYIPVMSPSPWYWPYTVVWPNYVPSYPLPTVICQNGFAASGGTLNTGSAFGAGVTITDASYTSSGNAGSATFAMNNVQATCINGSVAKYATVGSYEVNGHIVNLR